MIKAIQKTLYPSSSTPSNNPPNVRAVQNVSNTFLSLFPLLPTSSVRDNILCRLSWQDMNNLKRTHKKLSKSIEKSLVFQEQQWLDVIKSHDENKFKKLVHTLKCKEPGSGDEFNIHRLYAGENTLLHLVARYGTQEMLSTLLKEKGLHIHAQTANADGNIPLHLAIFSGNVEKMALLDLITERQIKNHHGNTPNDCREKIQSLHNAIDAITDPAGRLELELDTYDTQMINGIGQAVWQGPPLIHAARLGYKNIVEQLIKAGAELNEKDFEGHTALMIASEIGNKEVVKLLIEAGAPINEESEYGYTALLRAAVFGRDKVVKLLIKARAQINQKNYVGATALIIAATFGYDKVVKLLIEAGAELNEKDRKGDTALIKAMHCRHEEIVKLLIKAGKYDWDTVQVLARLAGEWLAEKSYYMINVITDGLDNAILALVNRVGSGFRKISELVLNSTARASPESWPNEMECTFSWSGEERKRNSTLVFIRRMYGLCGPNNTTKFTGSGTRKEFDETVDKWEKSAPKNEDRTEAARRMKASARENSSWLVLAGLPITSLPDISFLRLTNIILSDTNLATINPNCLPSAISSVVLSSAQFHKIYRNSVLKVHNDFNKEGFSVAEMINKHLADGTFIIKFNPK